LKRFLKYTKYFIEAFVLYLLFFIFSIIPLKFATNFVAWLLPILGRFHHTNQVALNNIKHAFPNKSQKEIEEILKKSWQNLGITAVEFAHFAKADFKDIEKNLEIRNEKYFTLTKQLSKACIYVSAHLGNWELASRLLVEKDPNTALIYRKAKNPLSEFLIQKHRLKYAKKIIPKGEIVGFKEILKHLKSGGSLGLLADQHLSSGVEINFFGRAVRAPHTPAELATKFNLPIFLSRVIRDKNGKYILDFEPPIIAKKGDDIKTITEEIYKVYEKWITENPEQWFWQHKRWRGFLSSVR
jgi:KDO2-lipid IV(A) lauroyltransferase